MIVELSLEKYNGFQFKFNAKVKRAQYSLCKSCTKLLDLIQRKRKPNTILVVVEDDKELCGKSNNAQIKIMVIDRWYENNGGPLVMKEDGL